MNVLQDRQSAISGLWADVEAVIAAPSVPLGEALPPNTSGVYLLEVSNKVVYVGEAIGSKGLRDRLLSKHLSGDDSHAVQRAYKGRYPDRAIRRAQIKLEVYARWLAMEENARVSALERILIWLLKPDWNMK